MKNNIVVGLGEILWDVFPEKKILGGAPANFAYHVSQFGLEGIAVSAVGDDAYGREVMDSLSKMNLKYLVNVVDYPTGTVLVSLDEEGVPKYEICKDVAWDFISFNEKMEELARVTQTVCFGSLAQRGSVSRQCIRKFLDAMPEGCLKMFDINLRQDFYTKEVIHESLQLCNMLKINEDEVKVVSEMYGLRGFSEQQVCEYVLDVYELDVIILTRGSNGSFVFTPDELSYQPTPKVVVADTVGAGDSFTATFIASYLHGNSITDSHKLATEVSAYVCTQHGAMPKLPDTFQIIGKCALPLNS